MADIILPNRLNTGVQDKTQAMIINILFCILIFTVDMLNPLLLIPRKIEITSFS